MKTQFTDFTPKAMMALGNEIAASFQSCAASIKSCNEFTEGIRAETAAMLAKLQEERRARAADEADARKVFASELRSAVRALLDRAELTRETLASDIHAASDAFRKSRPRKAPVASRSRPAPVRHGAHARKH
jgi:DNA-binding protein H-NS